MVSRNNLPNRLLDILSPERVYVVGGSVRDRLLKKRVEDMDLVVRPDPAPLAEKVARKLEGTSFVLDEERGIYRVTLPDGRQVDFAQMRGKSIEDDLRCRDFSVNAMAVPLEAWVGPAWKKKIIDLYQGVLDVRKGQIRALSRGIIKEDPIRLLRAFRIAAEHGFTIPRETLSLIKAQKGRLRKSASERIREELLKTFSTPDAFDTLLLMEKTGLLEVFYPEVKRLRKTAPRYYGRGGVLRHTLEGIHNLESIIRDRKSWFPKVHKKVEGYLFEKLGGFPRLAHLKWAILLHDIGKPATAKIIEGRLRFFEHEHVGAEKVEQLASRYRWSTEETRRYARIVRHHMRPGNLATHENISDKAIHRFFRDLEDDAVGMLLVSLGDHLTYLTPRRKKKRNSPHEILTQRMINLFYRNKKKVLPPRLLDGHDIMKAFSLKPSRMIGELLRDLTEAQSEGRIKSKEEGLDYLRGRLDFHKKQEGSNGMSEGKK